MFGFSQTIPEVGVHEAYEALGREGHVLVDVRTTDEVQMQGVEGAINVPLDQLGSTLGQLAGYKTIHLICRSGSRSAMATQMLIQSGLSQAKNVSGGMIEWVRAGLPTT